MSKGTKNLISEFTDSQTIDDLENAITIKNLEQDLITVQGKDSVETVLKVLKDNYIHSAPVIDNEKKTSDNGTPFYAIVNLVDLLTAFVFQPIFNTFDTDSKLSELKEETLASLVASQTKVLKAPISDYLGLSKESKKLWALDAKDSLSKLLETFSVGVHRVLISHRSKEKNHWTFLSQTDVLGYLKMQSYRRDSKIGSIFLKKLSEVKLGKSDEKFVTLPSTASAITGFRHMLLKNELTALPVVDETGKLVNTLSATDFRGIGLDNLKDTLLPVNEFLTRHRGKGYKNFTVHSEEILGSAIDKLLLTGVHRIWVVDGDAKPISAVSLTDIVKTFSTFGPEV
jgi:CBS domain-containing protein